MAMLICFSKNLYKERTHMELEFKGNELSCFDTVLDTTILREEIMEMIVPDSCPDILRILDTGGKVCLKSKEVRLGGIDLAGFAKMELLYMPEGERGVFRLDMNIPFQYPVESGHITAMSKVSVSACLQSAETRLINPRKVLVRVNLLFRLQAYAPLHLMMMRELGEKQECGIEILPGCREASFLVAIEEKSFSFSDELTISMGKPEAKQLLKSNVLLTCGEARVIGSKMIFKGEASISILYQSMENTLASIDYVLPFSQLMEVSGAGENADCDLSLQLTSCEFILGAESAGNRRQISAALGILAQAVIRENRKMEYIADIYSLCGELLPEVKTATFSMIQKQDVRRQTVRELIETGVVSKSVANTHMSIGEVSQAREGDMLTLSAPADISILYFDENDNVCSASRRIMVNCQMEMQPDFSVNAHARGGGELYASAAAGGIEVRCSVDFFIQPSSSYKLAWVSGARWEDNEADRKQSLERPSLILRRPGGAESLWDIAKSCRANMQEIRNANNMENDTLQPGQLLLIPQKRMA